MSWEYLSSKTMKNLAITCFICLSRVCNAGWIDQFRSLFGRKNSNATQNKPGQIWDTLRRTHITQDQIPSVPCQLRISNLNGEQIEFHRYSNDKITYKAYAPKPGYHATEAVDDDLSLWAAKDKEKCIKAWTYSKGGHSLSRLDILSSGVITPHCFGKNGDIWECMEYCEFQKRLYSLLSSSRGVRVDGAVTSHDLCHVFDYVYRGIFYRTILPKFPETSLFYNNCPVWTPSDGKECVHATFLLNNERLCSIVIIDENKEKEELYLEFFKNKWTIIDKKVFKLRTDSIIYTNSSDEEIDFFVTPAVFDVVNVDYKFGRNYQYSNNEFDGIFKTKYVPLPNSKINKIVEGEHLIWEATGSNYEFRCLSCEIESTRDKTTLTLYIKEAGVLCLRFEKDEHGWKGLAVDEPTQTPACF